METTRHRKLEKTDSIPTDDIIMGTEEPKTETLEGKIQIICPLVIIIDVKIFLSLGTRVCSRNRCPVYRLNGETTGSEL